MRADSPCEACNFEIYDDCMTKWELAHKGFFRDCENISLTTTKNREEVLISHMWKRCAYSKWKISAQGSIRKKESKSQIEKRISGVVLIFPGAITETTEGAWVIALVCDSYVENGMGSWWIVYEKIKTAQWYIDGEKLIKMKIGLDSL